MDFEVIKEIPAVVENLFIKNEKDIILIVEDHGDLRKYIRENPV